ncbi:MAG: class I SAM-dependent methyltransferase [Candidatus Eisenbacteria bacterium]|nr:class I SAM-dependent methyltransferase [Candidatus Eisenbacteria bacterium]
MTDRQSTESKKGEIEFRRKLVQQQVDGKCIFPDEFGRIDMERILADRMKKTVDQMTLLRKCGITLSPYVEIGAERCQRSLVMEHDLNAAGAAVDISYDMLRSCDYYSGIFARSRLPLRVCGDANSLPFMSDSVPFVFCYETLHHFPDPAPIIKEVYRILSPGGCFFFDEEPYRRTLHLNLYKRKKAYSSESLNRGKIRRIFDRFFSQVNCNEVNHGVCENDSISIAVWRRALSCFEEKNVRLQSTKHIHSDLFSPQNQAQFLLAFLFGGQISGTCFKSGVNVECRSVQDVIVCPACIESGRELRLASVVRH